MSYFDELDHELRQLLAWADVRHEQGVPVKGKVNELKRLMARTRRELEKADVPKSLAEAEPNDLQSIRDLRPRGPRVLWDDFPAGEYRERVRGAFLGRAAGCTLGAPVEGDSPETMASMAELFGADFPPTDYWPAVTRHGVKRYGLDTHQMYTKPHMKYIPVDDDMTYTLLGLLILEEYGPDFSTAEVGKAWVKYVPQACTAEKVALENLKAGRSWKTVGSRNNPYMEWIGADIRSDPWGYACPGLPERAAEMAYRDAYLSHRFNGIYGEMYFSAVIAAAFAVDEPMEAIELGLSEIPKTCRLYKDLKWALRLAPKVTGYQDAWDRVQTRFGPPKGGMSTVHTNNNACLTVWGVNIGGRDLTKAISETVAMGYDNDCTAATVGSIVGACIGGKNVPEHWYKPFRNRCRTYMNGQEWFKITDIVKRFTNVARQTFESARA
jgi:ADP-ribosylglycohydrolase